MGVTRGYGLVDDEVTLLRDVLTRRRPELVPLVGAIGVTPLSQSDRERLRAAVVDEMCELEPGDGADRRDLELEELLLHLGDA